MPDKKLPLEIFKYDWPFPQNPSTFYRWKSRAAMCLAYFTSKLMFPVLNKIDYKNREVFMDALSDTSRPLLTVSNHRCNIDDPLMWTALKPSEFWQHIDRWRYILTAHNICFTKQWHTTIFSLGRCVPCVRGAGVFQAGVDECIDQMNSNGWIHVFPEGRVTEVPIRIKWGIARMISEAKTAPVLLPMWIEGMSDVWPKQKPYYPRFGKKVTVTIGEPIDTTFLREKHKNDDELTRRKAIADFVQEKLFSLGGVTPQPSVKSIPPPDEGESAT
ncbi:unnamed protein product [Bursaphelenchus xylophilus]|uniref:Tafazzin family protein n=1 Tax=Bursaphelenchus xylophilus TaxID=6326 RepID=A0A1I7SGW4_BURXY|nr:unnamed protein product [Bursaphelenchus xylophilus]CAG9114410.1 unnamed protein product [Bursaphelenchus xylophilus]